MTVEQQGKPEPEHQLKHRRDEGVEEGVVDRDAEDVVVPEFVEIGEPDKAAGNADLGIGDRQQHALDKGIGDKQPEQHDRRQQEGRGEPTLVLQQPGDRSAPRGAGVRSRGYGVNCWHVLFSRRGAEAQT